MPPVRHVALCGGVAANGVIRDAVTYVASAFGAASLFPPPALCTDNAAMIAWAALERVHAGYLPLSAHDASALASVDIQPRVATGLPVHPSLAAPAQTAAHTE